MAHEQEPEPRAQSGQAQEYHGRFYHPPSVPMRLHVEKIFLSEEDRKENLKGLALYTQS